MILSSSKFGSIDEILILIFCFICSIFINKSKKLSFLLPFIIPKSPMLIPLRTISFEPLSIISSNFLITLLESVDLLLPLARGIVQKEHPKLHPS